MVEIAPGVHRIPLLLGHFVNAYLIGDVLVDAGLSFSGGTLLRQLKGQTVAAHALTHVHPDHQGASHRVCSALAIHLWCGAPDAEAMESGDFVGQGPNPESRLARFQSRFYGPPHPVARRLHEGDQVAGFTVVETPGHTPGHISLWRETDGVLIVGDVAFNLNMLTGRVGLRPPLPLATVDPALNRRSARKLAALRPSLLCFGHGPPLADGDRFQEYVARLPAD